jgi:hypothetical protein
MGATNGDRSEKEKEICVCILVAGDIMTGSVMIYHRDYDTDAFFFFPPLPSPLAHPIPPSIRLDCSYSLHMTHTRPLRLSNDYFSLFYLWALRLRFLLLTHS